jgi:hypothetical protein
MRHIFVAIAFVGFLGAGVETACAQRQSFFVPPKNTDSQIDIALAPHYVALNTSVPRKNQLLLFFPGTGTGPRSYQIVSNTAADLGFHVINLTYRNFELVNRLCYESPDEDCHEKVRLEIIDGTDRTPLVDVDRPNSIENRTIKLLQYLQRTYPGDGWEQFLESDGSIKWASVVASGHSQGGGHAAVLGKYHRLVRVVMFAAMDYNILTMGPANWVGSNNATPSLEYYAFAHQGDQVYELASTVIWPAFGMDAFGPPVNVDTSAPPYENSHSLTSNLEIPPGTNPHSIVAVDKDAPRRPDGTPVYKPVWEYMLATPGTPDPEDTESPVVSDVALSKKKVKRRIDPEVSITWTSADNVGVVSHDILFSADGTTFSTTVAAGLQGSSQSFTWVVPDSVPKTKRGVVKVVARDAAGNTGNSVSRRLRIN